ncbi:MAG: hypothetical protein IMF07_07525 [Proteobacteria bacterium]|nr:hypothetical protein [Pseudomonadota bacterium]
MRNQGINNPAASRQGICWLLQLETSTKSHCEPTGRGNLFVSVIQQIATSLSLLAMTLLLKSQFIFRSKLRGIQPQAIKIYLILHSNLNPILFDLILT